MSKEIAVIDTNTPELALLEPSKAQMIKSAFDPMTKMLEEFEAEYNSIIDEKKKGVTDDLIVRARQARIAVSKIRIATGKAKDKQKEDLKVEDKAIMGIHNILVWAVKGKEEELLNIEKHKEILEAARLEKLQAERELELAKYVEEPQQIALSTMEDDVWKAYIEAKKRDFNIRKEAEAEAERVRVKAAADKAAEDERIRLENIRLKKEADEKEEEIKKKALVVKARGARLDAYVRHIKDYSAVISLDDKEFEEALVELAQKEADYKALEAENAKKEKAEKEKARKEKEALEKKLKEAEALTIAPKDTPTAILRSPKLDIVQNLVNDLDNLDTVYAELFKDHEEKPLYDNVSVLIEKTINYINQKRKVK